MCVCGKFAGYKVDLVGYFIVAYKHKILDWQGTDSISGTKVYDFSYLFTSYINSPDHIPGITHTLVSGKFPYMVVVSPSRPPSEISWRTLIPSSVFFFLLTIIRNGFRGFWS